METRFNALALATIEAINLEALEIAKSYTGQVVPGVNPGDAPREIHPGGWADVTSQMVNAFGQEAIADLTRKGVYIGELSNSAEYAVYVEALGYWVLSGLLEGPLPAIVEKRMLELAQVL